MTATILDGRSLARSMELQVGQAIHRLEATPRLDLIQVGERFDSAMYANLKAKACVRVGIEVQKHNFHASVSPGEVIELIQRLNDNPIVNGIFLQLPLPDNFGDDDTRLIVDAISAGKDVDGVTTSNQATLLSRRQGDAAMDGPRKGFAPCTPLAVMKLLDQTQVDLTGKHAVVIGRSNRNALQF